MINSESKPGTFELFVTESAKQTQSSYLLTYLIKNVTTWVRLNLVFVAKLMDVSKCTREIKEWNTSEGGLRYIVITETTPKGISRFPANNANGCGHSPAAGLY